MLPEVGIEGQKRLKASSVLIIGAGGLGSPASMYLAAAGIGTLGIVDFDTIDLSNLQRQILHDTDGTGSSKCQSARARLLKINPEVQVEVHEEQLSAHNVEGMVRAYDVIIDATDNFSARYLINDACVLNGKPNVYGAIYRFEGQASLFLPGEGPCYRCLFPDPPPPESVPNCAEGGVLGVLAGVIGVVQATEAIKYLLTIGKSLAGRLLIYDALEMRFDSVTVKRQLDCPICGDAPKITSVKEIVFACGPEENKATEDNEISPAELNDRLKNGTKIFLLDVRNADEYELCRIDGSTLIPLPKLQENLGNVNPSEEIVVYCKAGARSRKAATTMKDKGFSKVKTLRGGILAWISEIDSTMQKY